MLDSSLSERAPVGGAQSRLRTYMAALLVMGAVVLGIASLRGTEKGDDHLARAPESPAAVVTPPLVDPERISAADDDLAHAGWQRSTLDYLLPLSQQQSGVNPDVLTLPELAALPFVESRGRPYAVEGLIVAMAAEEYPGGGLLWTVVIDSVDGSRAIILKHALASDPAEGRPEDALAYSTEYLKEGDRVLVRGRYVQRRMGTFGGVLVKKPVPVLLAQPPSEAFRKVLPRAVPIEDPSEADWGSVKDRFLAGTRNLNEPALYEMLEWARKKGHASILEDIRSGKLSVTPWDQEIFLKWSDEIESKREDSPRPFTTAARGTLFKTNGIFASIVTEGWSLVPRKATQWGIHDRTVLILLGDHYGNEAFKMISAFPLSEYEGVTGELGEHITVYGYFLKNHTFATQKERVGGGRADITMPCFIVVHAEPVVYLPSPYRKMIWIIAGVMVVLAGLFYFVLIRGEQKESARMEKYRMKLKRRIRSAEAKRISAGGERGDERDGNAGDGNAGDSNAGDGDAGDGSAGDPNPGDPNAGDGGGGAAVDGEDRGA